MAKLSDKGTVATLNANDTVTIVLESGVIKRITTGNLSEAVRSNMISATPEKSGLMDKSNVNKLSSFSFYASDRKFIRLGRFTNAHNKGGGVLINISTQTGVMLVFVSFYRWHNDAFKNFTAELIGGHKSAQMGNLHLVQLGSGGITDLFDLYFEQASGVSIVYEISFSNVSNFEINAPTIETSITTAMTAVIS